MIRQLLTLILFSPLLVCAQSPTQEYLRMQEQVKKAHVSQQLDSGVYWMSVGQYNLADEKFLYALNNSRSVTSDLTFYFGKNSFFLRKYKQSIDWLNKYIQLKGTNGQFSAEAVELLEQAQAGYLKEKSLEVKASQQVLSHNYDIDCGPTGKVICPTCKGNHVIIKKGIIGDEYRTCPYCDEHGILTCDEYNALLRGQLKPKI